MFRRTAPDGLRLPGSVHDGLNAAGIELIPNMNNAADQHRGRSALHRSVVGNHRDLSFFTGRSNRRRIGVMRNNVGTLTNQRLGSIGLLARVIPSGGPDNADLNVGIDALSAERIGIDALKHFWNRQPASLPAR